MTHNTSQFGLSLRSLAEARAILNAHSKVSKAVIYGSRARGDHGKLSDLDLTLYGEDMGIADVWRVGGEFDRSTLPFTVDVCVFSMLTTPKFIAEIERDGRVFYDRATMGESMLYSPYVATLQKFREKRLAALN